MTIEENLVTEISAIFMELLEIMAEFVSMDFFTFFQELISLNDLQEKLTRLKLIPNSKAA